MGRCRARTPAAGGRWTSRRQRRAGRSGPAMPAPRGERDRRIQAMGSCLVTRVRPDLSALVHLTGGAPLTRFAPSPTGYLHLGHVVNAIYVWGIARASGGRILLRMEDHDRGRCRPEYEAAILEDIDWLGLEPDLGKPAEFRAGRLVYRQ